MHVLEELQAKRVSEYAVVSSSVLFLSNDPKVVLLSLERLLGVFPDTVRDSSQQL